MTEVITKQAKKKQENQPMKENIASKTDLETAGLGKLKGNNPHKTYNF